MIKKGRNSMLRTNYYIFWGNVTLENFITSDGEESSHWDLQTHYILNCFYLFCSNLTCKMI